MRTVLFLDDQLVRHTEFRIANPAPEAITYHVYTIAEFLHLLFSFPGNFDEISLDHDLGNEGLHGNGMMAVNVLLLLPLDRRPNRVIVHSWNMQAGDRMERALLQAGFNVAREPFADPTP